MIKKIFKIISLCSCICLFAEPVQGNCLPEPAFTTQTEQTSTEKVTVHTLQLPIYVTADCLNIRSGPSTDYQIIDFVDRGTKLIYLSSIDGWIKVERFGHEAYVNGKYVTFNKDVLNQTENESEIETEPITESLSSTSPALYTPDQFKYMGVLNYNGWKWTWYTSKMFNNDIGVPGQHSDDQGYICDENNYVVLASADLTRGTIVDTPIGKQGKIYDTGCPSGILDVYTCW